MSRLLIEDVLVVILLHLVLGMLFLFNCMYT